MFTITEDVEIASSIHHGTVRFPCCDIGCSYARKVEKFKTFGHLQFGTQAQLSSIATTYAWTQYWSSVTNDLPILPHV